MSQLKEPSLVKLFMGLIYKPQAPLEEFMGKVQEKVGRIDFKTKETPFDHSSYYQKEMGEGLIRKLITIETLIRREDIVEIKAFTNNLEEVFSYGEGRTINIDPGYLAQEHLILATGKGYSHRPYLGAGVYADLTLVYIKDEYRELDWTYPDYGNKEMRNLFKDLRRQYVRQLAEESNK